MDEQSADYAIGYGKPPVESRFQKGQSGNPAGRPPGTKKLVTLIGEALSARTGFPKADGAWMTYAEAIFAGLVAEAAGSNLKAKKLLFDVMVKLQQANICFPSERLPEIQLDEGDWRAEITGESNRLPEATGHQPVVPPQPISEPLPEIQPAEDNDAIRLTNTIGVGVLADGS